MNREQLLETIKPVLEVRPVPVRPGGANRIVVTPDEVVLRNRRTTYLIPDPEPVYEYAGIPKATAEHLSPLTLTRAINELLERKERYTAVVKGDQVVGMAPPLGKSAVAVERLLQTIEATVPGVEYNRALMLPKHQVSLETVSLTETPVRRGDLVRAGAAVMFSPFGTVTPVVQSFAVRLACTNGATSTEVLRRFEAGGPGEGDSVWQFFRKSIRDSYRAISRIGERWAQLANSPVTPENRAGILAMMLREAGITGEQAEAVRARALREPPTNEWEVLNLISYATSHAMNNPRQILRAQAAVARYADDAEHRAICPACRRPR